MSLSAHENTWIVRASFTASWKTNHHSSICTQLTERHFDFTYIKYIFKTIQLARRICHQKDQGINHRFTDLVPRFGTIFLRYGIDRDSTFTWLEMLPQKNDLKIPISEGRVVLQVDILQYCVCTVPICGSRENPTSGKKKNRTILYYFSHCTIVLSPTRIRRTARISVWNK